MLSQGVTDLGDITVGGVGVGRVLHIVDLAGAPIPGASLVIEAEFKSICLESSDRAAGTADLVADSAGVVRLRLPKGQEPVSIGVAARGFRPANVLLDRFGAEESRYTIELDRLPSLLVRLHRGHSAGPPMSFPATLRIESLKEDGVDQAELGLGVPAGSLRRSPEDPNLASVAGWFATEEPKQPGPGEYLLVADGPGRHRVHVSIAGLPPVSVESEVLDRGEPTLLEVAIPDGRPVSIVMRAPEQMPTDARLATDREIRTFRAWPVDPSAPLPRIAERGAGLSARLEWARRGARFSFGEKRAAPSARIWLRSDLDSLMVGPFSRRHGPLGELREIRVTATGEDELEIPYPAFRLEPFWSLVRFQIVAAGEAVVAPGLEIRIDLRQEARDNTSQFGLLGSRFLRTDRTGWAAARIPPGRYRVGLSSSMEPHAEREFVVHEGQIGFEFRIEMLTELAK